MKKYIIIKELELFYDEKDALGKIITEINSGADAYQSLEKAQDANDSMDPNSGIIEIQVEDAPLQQTEELKVTNYTVEQITAIYIKGFRIPSENLSLSKYEAEHIKNLQYDKNNMEILQLSEPPLLYISKLHPDLLFLLFIDYALFDYKFQNWQKYNEREPGCVADLFITVAKIVCDYVTTHTKKPHLSTSDFISLHSLLSKSVFGSARPGESGSFRKHYNTFPLLPDTATINGIEELLLRIQHDKHPQGFMLGEFKKLEIIKNFCFYMEESCFDLATSSSTYSSEEVILKKFEEIKQQAILDTCDEILQNTKSITKDDICCVINQFMEQLQEQNPITNIDMDKLFFGRLRLRFQHFQQQPEITVSQFQFELDVKYSREHALACAGIGNASDIGYLNESEIKSLAHKIMHIIQEQGEIHLFTPEPKLAQKWASEAIDTYNQQILSLESIDQKIELISNLTHELEILHLFYDANCRTVYLLMNELLLANGIKWSILYDPNRLDALSSEERKDQIKQGIFRFMYVINQTGELLEKNLKIDLQTKIDKPESYANIIEPLKKRIQEFIIKYADTLNTLIQEYQPVHPSKMFSTESNSNSKMMYQLLVNLQKTNNTVEFFQSANSLLQNMDTPASIKKHINDIENLTAFNMDWSLRTNLSLGNEQKI